MQSKYANGETSKGDELRFGRKYLSTKGKEAGKGGRNGVEEGKGRRGRAVIQLKMSRSDKAVMT